MRTYLIYPDGKSIVCLRCEHRSSAAHDIAMRYCPACHLYHEEVQALPGTKYVLETPTLPTYGVWEYTPCSQAYAVEWLHEGPWTSAIGSTQLAHLFSLVTATTIPAGPPVSQFAANDEALVIAFTQPHYSALDPQDTTNALWQSLSDHVTYALLRRLA